jgi:CMP-N,N'-diacetyllegionaminic acid synthase
MKPQSPNILALIPSNQESKSISNKTGQLFAGKPLLAYSIEQAFASRLVTRVIVSTDSQQDRQLAESLGAEVPFLRTAEISGDFITDLEIFQHALTWLHVHEDYIPEIIVHLRPTSPFRDVADIDAMITQLLINPRFDSVRAVCAAPHTPYQMWSLQKDGSLAPLLQLEGITEPFNQPLPMLPQVYLQTGTIDVTRYTTIVYQHSMTGQCVGAYIQKAFNPTGLPNEREPAERLIVQTTAENRSEAP